MVKVLFAYSPADVYEQKLDSVTTAQIQSAAFFVSYPAEWKLSEKLARGKNLTFQEVAHSLGTPQSFHTLSEIQYWVSADLMSHTKFKHRAICLPKLFGNTFGKMQLHGSTITLLVTAVFSYPIGWMLSHLHL